MLYTQPSDSVYTSTSSACFLNGITKTWQRNEATLSHPPQGIPEMGVECRSPMLYTQPSDSVYTSTSSACFLSIHVNFNRLSVDFRSVEHSDSLLRFFSRGEPCK